MSDMNEIGVHKKVGPQEGGHEVVSTTNNSIDTGNEEKWRRVLRLLSTGRKLTRFDVEPHGDHCFNTSVSVISKKGFRIAREPIVINGKFGTFRCKRYWLEPDEQAKALRVLGATP